MIQFLIDLDHGGARPNGKEHLSTKAISSTGDSAELPPLANPTTSRAASYPGEKEGLQVSTPPAIRRSVSFREPQDDSSTKPVSAIQTKSLFSFDRVEVANDQTKHREEISDHDLDVCLDTLRLSLIDLGLALTVNRSN